MNKSVSFLSWRQAIAFALLLLGASAFAWALTPHQRMALFSNDLTLEADIPRSFQGWRLDESLVSSVVNPQQVQLLNELYSQSLSRVYVNGQGQKMMLSISYGGKQEGNLELHRPEVCYVAQGSTLQGQGTASLVLGEDRAVSLVRLLADKPGSSREPVSYWMRVGDDVISSGLSQQLSRIKHGLQGYIPDGVLFRVSSYSPDAALAYALQEDFVRALFASTSPRMQRFLVGPVSANRLSQSSTLSPTNSTGIAP
jgi:EpsI family protein